MKRKAIIAFLVGVAISAVLITVTSESPVRALESFFTKPFASKWYFGNMLNKMSLLIFAGAGVFFAFQTGNFNLGGEGQIYLAGFLTAVLLQNNWGIPGFLQFIIVFLIVCAITGMIGMLSGFLKMKYNITELLTSFLLSSAIIPVVDYLIMGPMRGHTANLLATANIQEQFELQHILIPSSLNISFFFAILIPIGLALMFSHTRVGYRLKISGIAPEFAMLSGFNQKLSPIIGMGISAMFHGITGFFAITGTYSLCHLGFSGGMGWGAIAIGLMAGSGFYAIIPASFVYSWIELSSTSAILSGSFRFNTAVFLQAVIFLLVSANIFTKKIKRKAKKQ